MKKLLTILLSVLMCVCLVNINTNRIVKADDQNVEPKQEEVLKEEVPVEEEKKEEVVTPQEEEKKEEEITPEEKKEIEEVIKEINEEEKTACLASENTTWSDEDGCVCNEQDRTWSHLSFGCKTQEELEEENKQVAEAITTLSGTVINGYDQEDITVVADAYTHTISYQNEDGEPVTPEEGLIPEGITFDADGNLELDDFSFKTPTKASIGILIKNIPTNDTLTIKLIETNKIQLDYGDDNNTNKYGIKADGNIKFVKAGDPGEDCILDIEIAPGSKVNYGIYSSGSITSEINNTDQPEKNGIEVVYDSNGANKNIEGKRIGIRSEKDITFKGPHYLEVDFNLPGVDNIAYVANGKLTLSGLDDSSAGPNMELHLDASLMNDAYFNAGIVASEVVFRNSNVYIDVDSEVYGFAIASSNVSILGDKTDVYLDSGQQNSLMFKAPTLGSDVKGLAMSIYDGDKYIKYNENNFKEYEKVRFSGKPLYTVTLNNGGHGELEPLLGFSGDNIVAPSASTLKENGYTFNGWYLDETLQTPLDKDALFTKNMPIYAKWTATPVILPYTLGGGVVNKPFKQQLRAAGGTVTSWEDVNNKLTKLGLSLNTATGAVTGTPKEAVDKETVKIKANFIDGSTATYDFTITIDNSTYIDFNNDPAKALMLLKEYDSKATYEQDITVKDSNAVTNSATLTIHNLNYTTNNGCGIALPDFTKLVVYGTNTIKVNGTIKKDSLKSSLNYDPILVVTKLPNLSFGMIAIQGVTIVNGEPGKEAKLKVSAYSNIDLVDGSIGLLSESKSSQSINIQDVDCEFIGGEATTLSCGALSTNKLISTNSSVSGKLNVLSSNVKFIGSKTQGVGTAETSIGLSGSLIPIIRNGSTITMKGYDVAKASLFGKSVDTQDNVAKNDDLNEEQDSLQLSAFISRNYVAYGSNKVDEEANTLVSFDTLSRSTPENIYLGDGDEVVKNLVLKNAKYDHSLFFHNGKFYKDSLYVNEFKDLNDKYSYDSSTNTLTLNNFVFETSARTGLVFDDEIVINSKDGTNNIISCELNSSGGLCIYAADNITFGGSGKLQVSTPGTAVYADGAITIDNGNNRFIGRYGLATSYIDGNENSVIYINDGDSYIYGVDSPLYYEVEDDTNKNLMVEDGLYTLDTCYKKDLIKQQTINIEYGADYFDTHEEYIAQKLILQDMLDPNSGTYIGMKVVDAKSIPEIETCQWHRTVKTGTVNYSPITLQKDKTSGNWGWYKYESGKITDKKVDIDPSTWSFNEAKATLTLKNFNYTTNANEAIVLDPGIEIVLKGENNIKVKPYSSDIIVSKSFSSKIQSPIIGIHFTGIKTAPITFTGDGSLNIEIQDSGRAFLKQFVFGIFTGDINDGEGKTASPINFKDKCKVTVNGSAYYEFMGIIANLLAVDSSEVNVNGKSYMINNGIYVNKGIEATGGAINVKAKGGQIGANVGIYTAGDIVVKNDTKTTKFDIEVDGGVSPQNTKNASSPSTSGIMVPSGTLALQKADVKIKVGNSSSPGLTGIMAKTISTEKSKLSIDVGNTFRGSEISIPKDESYSFGIVVTGSVVHFTSSDVNVKTGNSIYSCGITNIMPVSQSSNAAFDVIIDTNSKVNITTSPAMLMGVGIMTSGLSLNGFNANKQVYTARRSTVNRGVYLASGTDTLMATSEPKLATTYTNNIEVAGQKENAETGVEVHDSTLTVNVGKAYGYKSLTLGQASYGIAAPRVIVDKSTVKTHSDTAMMSFAIYASKLEQTGGSIEASAKYNDTTNAAAGIYAEGSADCTGNMSTGVYGSKATDSNAGTYYPFASASVTETMLTSNYIKYPAGASIKKVGSLYIIVGKDGKPVKEGSTQGKPTPTPSPSEPVVKDESCEKVIGPTWHWNNDKGICEEVGVVGTSTR